MRFEFPLNRFFRLLPALLTGLMLTLSGTTQAQFSVAGMTVSDYFSDPKVARLADAAGRGRAQENGGQTCISAFASLAFTRQPSAPVVRSRPGCRKFLGYAFDLRLAGRTGSSWPSAP